MAPYLDYDALRAQAMGSGNDEAVTVNTRALIDKVLARYSGEWTTLRELLQNAADASAKEVIIRLETLPSASIPLPQTFDSSARLKHVILHHTLKQTIVENNGQVFQATDWARLKKIAEGNPDETKIGAFGVGFYSVFAECEEPFVSSGKEALAFYWKGDALFTRKLQLGDNQSSNTTFVLPMRNRTSPVPQLLSLSQFLAGSLTFVGLECIELWIDEWRILKLDKVTAPSSYLDLPREVVRKTQEGLMEVSSVRREAAKIHAHWLKVVGWDRSTPSDSSNTETTTKGTHSTPSLRSFFSRLATGTANATAERAAKHERALQAAILEDLMGESNATIFLHVNKAAIRTNVSQKFGKELERATKKPPPKATTVSLLTASYDEHVASTSTLSNQGHENLSIFSSVVPTKGRIFIGFPTNQTTGLQAHISTPSVIPTVERESIDLNNRFIRTWNIELLRVAGIVARLSWSAEMAELGTKLLRVAESTNLKQPDTEQVSQALPEALFIHNVYTWNESTPASEVGNLVEESFWTCNRSMAIDVLSSRGVLPSSSVRILTEELGFVEGIAVLPAPLVDTGPVKRLREYGVITDITISDIKSELESRPLDLSQLQCFLEWVGHKARINEIDGTTVRSLLKVAVVNDKEAGQTKIIEVGQMMNFLNPSRIPAEMPVPPTTMPFRFTKAMSKADLDALGWEDLHIVPWLRWLVDNVGGNGDLPQHQDITLSPSFARSVLPVLSKQWEGLSQSSKATVVELISARTVMPTKMGMRKPSESYFPSVKLFEDLPVVVGINSVKDKMLAAFGVRKTIEIGVVFDRLMAPPSYAEKEQQDTQITRWSHVELIKYLTSIRQDIPSNDIKRLMSTPICTAELKDGAKASTERYLVSDLYEPDDALRRLGLPILQWPGVYRCSSAEGKFLSSLGLRSAPSYPDLVEIMVKSCASGDVALRDRALSYLINQYQLKGYANFSAAAIATPFLPVEGSETRLQTPSKCFINERSALLGFEILQRNLKPHASKFGVQSDPPMAKCVERLIQNPPRSHRNAREIFAYFASRVTELDNTLVGKLVDADIVPLKARSNPKSEKAELSGDVRYIAPSLCFLGDDIKYADIFDYVDFGQDANVFLLKCGSKHEPNTQELAAKVIREPTRVYTALETTRYLDLLRNLADSWETLKKNKTLVRDMKSAPFLLGYRELASKSGNAQAEDDDGEEEEATVRTAELSSASKITIINDMITYRQFKEQLLAAPMEETLEEFYINLGSSELGDLLEQKHSIGSRLPDQNAAVKLHRLVTERTRLFLHDTPKDMISHDAKWIEKNLSVISVRTLSLRKSLRGTNFSHVQAKSAIVSYERQTGFILYIIPKYDFFEVAQGLMGLLLKRSKIQQTMILEMLLETELVKLRARGYNVERILRQKANEARMAEEQRTKQLVQEQKELKEREMAWNESEARAARDREQNLMPGNFPDTPDRKHTDQVLRGPAPVDEPPPLPSQGFFAQIGRRLGIDDRRHSSQTNLPNRSITNTTEDAPPPYSHEGSQKASQAPQPEPATAPHHLQRNILSAISASRSYNSSTLSSTPSITDVKETHSYCDSKPAHSITYIAETSTAPPIRIFLSNDLLSPPYNLTPQKFLAANAGAVNAFASILLDSADIYKLSRSSIHVFYDASGSTIAFNQDRALFFNYRYFESLHLEAVQRKEKGEALIYWSVVLAHELAHNIVADHSANHSYYTEALVIQFFPALAAGFASVPSSAASRPSIPNDPLRERNEAAAEGSARLLDVD